ncbi:MAG TPA: sialate O-acetylesterase [Verrucomicrobiae bacterium]|jgi:sialate O-acetylesterase
MIQRKLFPLSLRSILFLVCSALAVRADVKLPALFTDHMVLQQGQSLKVWGWAEAGEQVTVAFRKQRVTIQCPASGKWMVTLKSEKAGGPDTLTVSGKNSITINDVLVGEVWVASGQSNMEFALRNSFASAADIAASAHPDIRLFTVPKLKADAPVDDVKASWLECKPETVPGMSAVAYYFARDLQKARQVPVGIIHTSWGGSPAEVWMSERVLSSNPDYKRAILDPYPEQKKKFETALKQWEADQAEAKQAGKEFTKRRPGLGWKPTELYNGMIAPLIPYSIKGAIWYQGESNAGRAHEYRSLMADLIRNWRRDWDEGNLTFLQVQLAPFMAIKEQPAESSWAELREAQSIAAHSVGKAGVAVITDVGDPKDIHPTKKEPVGARLALAARGLAYGEKIVSSGPVYRSMKVKGDQIILRFDSVGAGLEARGGELKGFAIAGEDRKFVWAKAEIQGDAVVASSPEVKQPVAVRYGWADFPVVNFWNKDGLPASPFRTDKFPMITEPKQIEAKK